MFQERARTIQGIAHALDVVGIALAFVAALVLRVAHDAIPILNRIPAAYWTTEKSVRSEYAVLFLVNIIVWIAVTRRLRVYLDGSPQSLDRILYVCAKVQLLAILVTGGVVFALKMRISRLFFAYFFIAVFVILFSKQLAMSRVLTRLRLNSPNRRHALIIGSAQPAAWLAEVVSRAEHLGYEVAEVLSLAPEPDAKRTGALNRQLERILEAQRVDEVFIVGSARELAELAPAAQSLIERGLVVSIVSAMTTSGDGVRGRITSFSGVPMISYGPMPRDEAHLGLKRLIDLSASVLALVVLGPLMLGIALIIRFDGGPAIFAQERLGYRGRGFRLYKFRSMHMQAEQRLNADPVLHRKYIEGGFKIAESEDPRITRFGRFLRRTSLDELPQFWNILRGDMTLVGPRPIVPLEIENYQPYAELFLTSRPGLTGHWQVNGRSEIQYPERVYLDLDYVGSHSLRDDLAILARTVPAVIRRRGAH